MPSQATGYVFLQAFWLLLNACKTHADATPTAKQGKRRTLWLAFLAAAPAFSRHTETPTYLRFYNAIEKSPSYLQ